MSETPHDHSGVVGTSPAGSPEVVGSSSPVPPAEERAPGVAGSPGPRSRPGAAAAPALHRDITRALAAVRRARLVAVASTAPELAHDVELAEWRLNRLLERTTAVPPG